LLAALRLARTGRSFSLSVPRFTGMPLFPGHPPFQVSSYRTPRGIRVAGDRPWKGENEAGLSYMSEVISGTAHSGAHIDALAHMTIGPDATWFGGGQADLHLSDFGPTLGDAAKLPPFVRRGVLLDAAGWRGEQCLPKGHALDASALIAIAAAQDVEVRLGDVVLIRTGYLSHWPDEDMMAAHRTPGPDIDAARWLCQAGVVATGSDTETYEVQPAPDPGSPSNPQPVHTHLLIENGIYLFESLYLEELAAASAYEFLFIALPLKIAGATGSMVDPLAIL
jgi:kynurenine formamidase